MLKHKLIQKHFSQDNVFRYDIGMSFIDCQHLFLCFVCFCGLSVHVLIFICTIYFFPEYL